jgi:hypothetical protein
MFEKQIKRMKLLDFALAKLSIAAFVIFFIAIWPAARNWLLGISPWYFLAVSVVAVVIVQSRIWKK